MPQAVPGTLGRPQRGRLRGFGRKVLQRADRADFGVAVFAASRELSKAGIQATKMELACHTCHTCAENCEYFDVI